MLDKACAGQDHKAIPFPSSSSSLLCCKKSTSSFSIKGIDVRVKLRFSHERKSLCDGLYWVIRPHSSRLSFFFPMKELDKQLLLRMDLIQVIIQILL